MTSKLTPASASFASEMETTLFAAPSSDLLDAQLGAPQDLDARSRSRVGAVAYPYDAETMQILWDDRIATGG